MQGHFITDVSELDALYGEASETSRRKETDHIHPLYARFIAASPFAILATRGPDGADASPRGERPGFAVVEDAHTLLLPDRRGNNRLDSLRNIVTDPVLALLFLIPGVGETLRVNGRGRISTDPSLLARFVEAGKLPRSVLVVTVEAVYFQCAKAIIRSDLWNPALHVVRESLPSAGQILADVTRNAVDGAEYDRALPQRLADTLY